MVDPHIVTDGVGPRCTLVKGKCHPVGPRSKFDIDVDEDPSLQIIFGQILTKATHKKLLQGKPPQKTYKEKLRKRYLMRLI